MYVDGPAHPDASRDEKERLEKGMGRGGYVQPGKGLFRTICPGARGTCTHLPNMSAEKIRKKLFKIHT